MSRPLGAKNKSKFISVTLEEMNKKFHPNAIIKIDANYAMIFEIEKNVEQGKKKEQDEEIEMVVS